MAIYSDIVIFESLDKQKLVDDINEYLDTCDNHMDIDYKPIVYNDEEGLSCILYTAMIKHKREKQ